MSEKMTREDVARIARECSIGVSEGNTFADDCYISVLYRFAHKVIEHFLDTTGQYVTNDASREEAIQAAVESEREACAKGCETSVAGFGSETEWADGYIQAAKDIAEGIRTRGEK